MSHQTNMGPIGPFTPGMILRTPTANSAPNNFFVGYNNDNQYNDLGRVSSVRSSMSSQHNVEPQRIHKELTVSSYENNNNNSDNNMMVQVNTKQPSNSSNPVKK